jgi:hypothetical protein
VFVLRIRSSLPNVLIIHVATYAAAVLFRLSDEKPYEMKQRFGQDSNLAASYHDDHMMNNVRRDMG